MNVRHGVDLLVIGVGLLLRRGSSPGSWHGLTLLVTFVVSLFNDEVGGYEASNGGHQYDLGFVLGAGDHAQPEIFARRRWRPDVVPDREPNVAPAGAPVLYGREARARDPSHTTKEGP